MTQAAKDPFPTTGDLVAKPDLRFRAKWLLMGFVLLGWGGWSLYDGYVRYPRLNAEAIAEADRQGKPRPEKLPHPGYDIPLNKLIGWSLQPLGLAVVAWTFYRTRGEYRLSDDGGGAGTTLHAPGHPPVPLDSIRKIDKSKWERKGVAYLEYERPDSPGVTSRLALDNFIYEREPTDEIFRRIRAALTPAS
jgi:hypothetical protein